MTKINVMVSMKPHAGPVVPESQPQKRDVVPWASSLPDFETHLRSATADSQSNEKAVLHTTSLPDTKTYLRADAPGVLSANGNPGGHAVSLPELRSDSLPFSYGAQRQELDMDPKPPMSPGMAAHLRAAAPRASRVSKKLSDIDLYRDVIFAKCGTSGTGDYKNLQVVQARHESRYDAQPRKEAVDQINSAVGVGEKSGDMVAQSRFIKALAAGQSAQQQHVPEGHADLAGAAGTSRTFARIFLEHWYGNGYLSTVIEGRGLPHLPGAISEAHLVSRLPEQSPSQIPSAAYFRGTLEQGATNFGAETTLAWLSGQGMSIDSSVAELAVAETSDASQHASEALRYPSCLVWQSQSQAGQVNLWIRDFTLRESDRAELVRQALLLAQNTGYDIARITVNGHEAWAASHTRQISTKEA